MRIFGVNNGSMDLSVYKWKIIEPIPRRRGGNHGHGRPWRNAQPGLNGILWVLRTEASWKNLPEWYPPYQTYHRRFQRWLQDGTLEAVLKALAEDLKLRGKLDLTETFIDATFASAQKGDLLWVLRSVGRGPRSWPLQTALVFLSPFGLEVLVHMKRARRARPQPPHCLRVPTAPERRQSRQTRPAFAR